jgi:hypothetical protein
LYISFFRIVATIKHTYTKKAQQQQNVDVLLC